MYYWLGLWDSGEEDGLGSIAGGVAGLGRGCSITGDVDGECDGDWDGDGSGGGGGGTESGNSSVRNWGKKSSTRLHVTDQSWLANSYWYTM